ncbi:hypothetical protein ACMA1D_21260 [Streptomyces sp. 796.1]|uniref:hypothetical protein n=1 Tax=Streptomyces sp. 796.1 TaxID=3163029 RepID=UPI0039C9350F
MLGLACTPETPSLTINEKQFGKKWGRHAQDYGLDPSDASARTWFRTHLANVRNEPDEIRRGPYNPQGGGGEDYFFYRQGKDLVITKPTGEFVTMFPQDRPNQWLTGATTLYEKEE